MNKIKVYQMETDILMDKLIHYETEQRLNILVV
uniref:Uncharacterized protein n=1 Tax=Tetranychus urticae TaxID=32264 RepID=T1L4Q3_TETUR